MSQTRNFLRASGIVFFASFLAAGAGYLLKIVLARNLSIEDFGLFSAVFAFVGLFVGFSDLGIGMATVRYIAEFNVEKKLHDIKNALLYLFIFQLAFLVIVFLSIAFLAPLLSEIYFKNPSATGVLFVLLVAFSFSVFEAFFSTAFYGFKRMIFFSSVQILKPVLVLLAVLVFLPLGFGIMAPAYAYLLAFAVGPLLYFLMFRKTFPEFFHISTQWDPALAKQQVFSGISILLGGLGAVLLANIGTLLLTHFRPLSEVALYSVALSIINLIRQVPKALSVVLLPVSAELNSAKHPQFKAGIRRLYIYTFIVGIPLVFSMIFFARLIITLLFGNTYELATLPLQILAAGSIPLAILLINESLFKGIGKQNNYAVISGIGAAVGIISSVVLIPLYGTSGAAVGFVGATILMMLLSLLSLQKQLSVELPLFPWFKTGIAGFALISVLYCFKVLLNLSVFAEAAVTIPVASGVYLLALLLLRVTSIGELRRILANVL